MNRTLLILSGALIVAGIAFFYVYADAYINEATGGARIRVVVAALDIPFGQPMQATWLTIEEVPQAYVEDRHLRASDLRGLIGVPLAQSVRTGEAILRTDLSVISNRQRTLSTEIPSGRRALSIHAQQESSHAGLLRPGDRVDVLLLVGDHRIPDSARVMVVAQNLLVLSVGHFIQDRFDDDRERAMSAFTTQISLEVGLETAQRLTLSRRQGRLRVLLRNPNDATVIEEPPEIRETVLFAPSSRAAWLRRFALVEAAAPPPVESTEGAVPDAE